MVKIMKAVRKSLFVLLFLCNFLQFFLAHRYGCKFDPEEMECVSLLGWFTREDHLADGCIELEGLQPGDILITTSTHSMGWRHGHAGLVVDEDTVLECVSLGENSTLVDVKHWGTYSNVAVLRVKDITEEIQKEVVAYALEYLLDVPYHLSAGFLGKKAPEPDEAYFGLHCSYLVWYAWNYLEYDLDSDGGRLVTCQDLLGSEDLEVIQKFGM